MPGVQRLSLDRLYARAEECLQLGVPAMALFPVIDTPLKSLHAEEAYNDRGLAPRAVAGLKSRFPERIYLQLTFAVPRKKIIGRLL